MFGTGRWSSPEGSFKFYFMTFHRRWWTSMRLKSTNEWGNQENVGCVHCDQRWAVLSSAHTSQLPYLWGGVFWFEWWCQFLTFSLKTTNRILRHLGFAVSWKIIESLTQRGSKNGTQRGQRHEVAKNRPIDITWKDSNSRFTGIQEDEEEVDGKAPKETSTMVAGALIAGDAIIKITKLTNLHENAEHNIIHGPTIRRSWASRCLARLGAQQRNWIRSKSNTNFIALVRCQIKYTLW